MVITETTKTGIPTLLENGAEVLSYTERHPGGNGFKRHGVALCHWRDEYVTWNIMETVVSPGVVRWDAETGHYHRSIVDAAEDYRDRGGR